MSELIDPEQIARKDTRRAWKFILGALVLVSGLFAWVMLFYDCPPPDDSHIMPRFTESPGGYNPLAVFCEEMKAHDFEEGLEEQTKTYLAKHPIVMQAFEKLIRTDTATWRWPGGTNKASYNFKSEGAEPIHYMATTIRMKAYDEAEDGKMDMALRTSLQLTKYAHGLEGAEGALNSYLAAVGVSFNGKSVLKRALLGGDADIGMLVEAQRELAACEPRSQDMSDTLMVEALYSKNRFKAFKNGKIETLDFGDPHPGFKRLFLKPNFNQASYTHFIKPLIDGFSVSWEKGWSSCQKGRSECEKFLNNEFQFWVSPNAYGNWLTKRSLPTFESGYKFPLINVIVSRQYVIILALRRFELEQRSLPDTLEALVPQYLSAVPMDPFANAPMRWNAKTKVIYSVGEDGIDDGGREERKYLNNSPSVLSKPDIGMSYWWIKKERDGRESKE